MEELMAQESEKAVEPGKRDSGLVVAQALITGTAGELENRTGELTAADMN